jgi:hypothetical protein
MLVDASRSTSMGFWRFSRDYLRAAKAVEAASDDSISFPALYLYGLTIELALKAFLLKRGVALQKVKRLSHRLAEILLDARSRRLGLEVKLSCHDVAVIRLLDILYSSNELRYIVTGTVRIPPVSDVARIAEHLVRGLERYCTGTTGRV